MRCSPARAFGRSSVCVLMRVSSFEHEFLDLTRTLLKTRLGCKGRQLEVVRPTGFVLGVEVIERLRDLHRIHHHLWPLLGYRQGAGARRGGEAVDYDVGHGDAMPGIF